MNKIDQSFFDKINGFDRFLNLTTDETAWRRDVDVDIAYPENGFFNFKIEFAPPFLMDRASKSTNYVGLITEIELQSIFDCKFNNGDTIKYGCGMCVFDIFYNNDGYDDIKFFKKISEYNRKIDEIVYLGNPENKEIRGLLNYDKTTNNAKVNNVFRANDGMSGSSLWTTKNADEILSDIDLLLKRTSDSSTFGIVPNTILLSNENYSYIKNTIIYKNKPMSILDYILENNIFSYLDLGLEINPCEYIDNLFGEDYGFFDTKYGFIPGSRVVAYSKFKDYIKFKTSGLMRANKNEDLSSIIKNTDFSFKEKPGYQVFYYSMLGCLEVTKPQTIGYMDGV